MIWLGLRGRKAIADLQRSVDEQNSRHQELLQAFRALELDMTSQVDRLLGIAKRIQGRRGGRPPNPTTEADGEAEAEPQQTIPGFSRHVL